MADAFSLWGEIGASVDSRGFTEANRQINETRRNLDDLEKKSRGFASVSGKINDSSNSTSQSFARQNAEVKDLARGLSSLTGLGKGLAAGGIFSAISAGISAQISALQTIYSQIQQATITAARFEGYEASFKLLTGSAAAARAEIADLDKLSRNTKGLTFESALQGEQRLRSVGFAAKQSQNLIEGLANLRLRGGGTAEDLKAVALNLAQIRAQGRLTGDELRETLGRLPAAGEALRKAFGTVDIGQIRALELTSKQFFDRFEAALSELPGGTQTAQDAWEKFVDSILRGQSAFGEPVLQPVTASLVELTKFVEENREAWASWGKATADAVSGVKALIVDSGLLQIVGDLAQATGAAAKVGMAELSKIGSEINSGINSLDGVGEPNKVAFERSRELYRAEYEYRTTLAKQIEEQLGAIRDNALDNLQKNMIARRRVIEGESRQTAVGQLSAQRGLLEIERDGIGKRIEIVKKYYADAVNAARGNADLQAEIQREANTAIENLTLANATRLAQINRDIAAAQYQIAENVVGKISSRMMGLIESDYKLNQANISKTLRRRLEDEKTFARDSLEAEQKYLDARKQQTEANYAALIAATQDYFKQRELWAEKSNAILAIERQKEVANAIKAARDIQIAEQQRIAGVNAALEGHNITASIGANGSYGRDTLSRYISSLTRQMNDRTISPQAFLATLSGDKATGEIQKTYDEIIKAAKNRQAEARAELEKHKNDELELRNFDRKAVDEIAAIEQEREDKIYAIRKQGKDRRAALAMEGHEVEKQLAHIAANVFALEAERMQAAFAAFDKGTIDLLNKSGGAYQEFASRFVGKTREQIGVEVLRIQQDSVQKQLQADIDYFEARKKGYAHDADVVKDAENQIVLLNKRKNELRLRQDIDYYNATRQLPENQLKAARELLNLIRSGDSVTLGGMQVNADLGAATSLVNNYQRIYDLKAQIVNLDESESLRVQAGMLQNIVEMREREGNAVITIHRAQMELSRSMEISNNQIRAGVYQHLAGQQTLSQSIASGINKTYDNLAAKLDEQVDKTFKWAGAFKDLFAEPFKALQRSKLSDLTRGFLDVLFPGLGAASEKAQNPLLFETKTQTGYLREIRDTLRFGAAGAGAGNPFSLLGGARGSGSNNPFGVLFGSLLGGGRSGMTSPQFNPNGSYGNLGALLGMGGGSTASGGNPLTNLLGGLVGYKGNWHREIAGGSTNSLGAIFGRGGIFGNKGFGLNSGTIGAVGSLANIAGGLIGGGVGRFMSNIGTGAALGAQIGSIVPGIGTAIGAAVGAAAGLVASFFGGDKSMSKLREAIASYYGVKVAKSGAGKALLKQIKGIGEAALGKGAAVSNALGVIKLPEVQELISNYAAQTNQTMKNAAAAAVSTSPTLEQIQSEDWAGNWFTRSVGKSGFTNGILGGTSASEYVSTAPAANTISQSAAGREKSESGAAIRMLAGIVDEMREQLERFEAKFGVASAGDVVMAGAKQRGAAFSSAVLEQADRNADFNRRFRATTATSDTY